MSIYYSTSMANRVASLVVRTAGSEAVITFYNGNMPDVLQHKGDGEKVGSRPADEIALQHLAYGHEPQLPDGATYWRLTDNGGLVLMQGDGKP